jgi:hypothetical protein
LARVAREWRTLAAPEMSPEEMCAAALKVLVAHDEAAILAASTIKEKKRKKPAGAADASAAAASAPSGASRKRGRKGSKNKATLAKEAAAAAATAAAAARLAALRASVPQADPQTFTQMLMDSSRC